MNEGEICDKLNETAERLAAVERSVEASTQRIAWLVGCEQRLQRVRDDVREVRTKVSMLPAVEIDGTKHADVRNFYCQWLQEELDGVILPQLDAEHLVELFVCLQRIEKLVREYMLKSPDVSEWALRQANKEFDELWKTERELDEARTNGEALAGGESVDQ